MVWQAKNQCRRVRWNRKTLIVAIVEDLGLEVLISVG
jgi:hypothetical protein